MTNDCKTCPVSTGTHKPAEAVHQIDEPATAQAAPYEVMGALRALHDSVELAIQRGDLSERALEIIIMQPATDVLMRAAAPQAVQAAVPMFWVRLLRDGLHEGPVHNNSVGGKMLRDEKPGEWHPLYLHAATQPAAQGMEEEAQRNADIGAAVMRACKELPEGAEIQIYLERGAGTVNMTDWDGNEFDHFDQDHEDFACRINAAIDGAIAADQAASQAKQGEQANG